MIVSNKVKTSVLNTAGYLILLVQQIPGLWIWIPFMAAPVFLFITMLVSNLPTNIIEVCQVFFVEILSPSPPVLIGRLLIVLSLVVIVYSIVYLGVKKRTGLVTSGPYRFVRHPQYTGFLLLTIGLTGWSHFLITNFFGISWISAEATIALWYLELLAYIILALVEELYLSNKFGIEYDTYKTKTPTFIPFLKAGKFDIVMAIFIFSFLLFGVLHFP